MEADLQRYYGVALGDLFTGAMSWRRLRVLVDNLPRESATAARLHGEAVAWGAQEHLTATVIDTLNVSNWQRAQAGSKTRIPRPKPVPRPGEKRKERRYGHTDLSADDVKALLRSFDPTPVGG